MRRRPAAARLAVVLLAAWLAGCATLRRDVIEPEVRLVNLVPLEATLFEQRVRVDLRIVNPNEFPLEARGLRFELRLGGDRVATGVSDAAIRVPGLGEALVPVTVHTSSFQLVRQALSLGRDEALDYELDGTLLLEGHFPSELEFERSGRLDLD